MIEAFICDAVRTPIGRHGGALSSIRADDLGALPIAQLMARNAAVDWEAVDDLIYGCANQAGEDNRNVVRMSDLLAVLPELGIEDDAAHVNSQVGAIALGHPLGMSGARLVTTATAQLIRRQSRYALCTMCVGVGQGIAMIIERT